MPSGVYNEGAFQIGDGGIIFDTDSAIKIMLLKSSYTFDKDHTSVSDLTAGSAECDVSGYTGGFGGAGRKALASKTSTKDNTNDRMVYDAADPSAWTLGSGNTIGGAAVVRELTNDGASTPLFFIDFTDTATNGGTFTVSFHANGIAYLQQ